MTIRRELLEETGARLGEARLLGYQLRRILAPRPPDYRYPYPDSYQVFYVARLVRLDDLLATGEADGRALFGPHQARDLAWVLANRPLDKAAIGAPNSLLSSQLFASLLFAAVEPAPGAGPVGPLAPTP